MKISIIIPVHNEEKTLKALIRAIEQVYIPGFEKEIIIVDDGSNDSTPEIIEAQRSKKDVFVFLHARKEGKGEAIKTGLRACSGDLVLIQDGDLEYDPQDYSKLVSAMPAGQAAVVYGSRFKDKRNKFRYPGLLANRFLSAFTNILYGSRLTDMETCYKLFRRKMIESIPLESKGFDFEPEITAKILRRGIPIHEVSISYQARGKKSGKKIGIKDGLTAVFVLLKHRFSNSF